MPSSSSFLVSFFFSVCRFSPLDLPCHGLHFLSAFSFCISKLSVSSLSFVFPYLLPFRLLSSLSSLFVCACFGFLHLHSLFFWVSRTACFSFCLPRSSHVPRLSLRGEQESRWTDRTPTKKTQRKEKGKDPSSPHV